MNGAPAGLIAFTTTLGVVVQIVCGFLAMQSNDLAVTIAIALLASAGPLVYATTMAYRRGFQAASENVPSTDPPRP
jgi:hypothetical protein